jgi:hypothetical protein
MDSVCGDDNIGLGPLAIREEDDGSAVILLKADALVTSSYDPGAQLYCHHPEQVGAVHSNEFNLVREIGRPHRRGIRTVSAEELRLPPARPQSRKLFAKSKPAQHPDAVRLQRDTSTDFGQSGRLFIDTHIYPTLNKGVGQSHPTDAAADDCDAKGALFHDKYPEFCARPDAARSALRSTGRDADCPWR